MSQSKRKKVTMICETCKGENVRQDAWAEWDTDAQKWVLAETFDNAFCCDCEGETTIIEEEKELKPHRDDALLKHAEMVYDHDRDFPGEFSEE